MARSTGSCPLNPEPHSATAWHHVAGKSCWTTGETAKSLSAGDAEPDVRPFLLLLAAFG
jgi:hypothetical protein